MEVITDVAASPNPSQPSPALATVDVAASADADPDGPDDHDEAMAERATVAAATTIDDAATPVVPDALAADAPGEPNCDRLIGLDSWYVSSSASMSATAPVQPSLSPNPR
jgi:hypothetical protein